MRSEEVKQIRIIEALIIAVVTGAITTTGTIVIAVPVMEAQVRFNKESIERIENKFDIAVEELRELYVEMKRDLYIPKAMRSQSKTGAHMNTVTKVES